MGWCVGVTPASSGDSCCSSQSSRQRRRRELRSLRNGQFYFLRLLCLTSVISIHFAFLKSKSKEPKQVGLWQAFPGNGQ